MSDKILYPRGWGKSTEALENLIKRIIYADIMERGMKNKPIKPVPTAECVINEYGIVHHAGNYLCPICYTFVKTKEFNYQVCPKCGQEIEKEV